MSAFYAGGCFGRDRRRTLIESARVRLALDARSRARAHALARRESLGLEVIRRGSRGVHDDRGGRQATRDRKGGWRSGGRSCQGLTIDLVSRFDVDVYRSVHEWYGHELQLIPRREAYVFGVDLVQELIEENFAFHSRQGIPDA